MSRKLWAVTTVAPSGVTSPSRPVKGEPDASVCRQRAPLIDRRVVRAHAVSFPRTIGCGTILLPISDHICEAIGDPHRSPGLHILPGCHASAFADYGRMALHR